MTKNIFCARCQAETPHEGKVDANGEFVFTCTNSYIDPSDEAVAIPCGRFVKFPADTNPETFEGLLAKHQEANVGQVSIEAQEETLNQIMGEQAPQEEEIEQPEQEPVA